MDVMGSWHGPMLLALLLVSPCMQEQPMDMDELMSKKLKFVHADTRAKIALLLRRSEPSGKPTRLSLRGGYLPEYMEENSEEQGDLHQPYHPSTDILSSCRVHVDAESGNDDSVT